MEASRASASGTAVAKSKKENKVLRVEIPHQCLAPPAVVAAITAVAPEFASQAGEIAGKCVSEDCGRGARVCLDTLAGHTQ